MRTGLFIGVEHIWEHKLPWTAKHFSCTLGRCKNAFPWYSSAGLGLAVPP